MIGLCSGLIGVGVTLLLLIPGNAILHHFMGTNEVSGVLPVPGAVALVVLSVVLTLIGGIIRCAPSEPRGRSCQAIPLHLARFVWTYWGLPNGPVPKERN